MASLREFRKKIKTVKATQQITKAMKMVSAARLRRAQGRIVSARPFAVQMRSMMDDLTSRMKAEDEGQRGPARHVHPLFEKRASSSVGLLLVTADKGLCGSFNTNLVRKAGEFLRQNQDKDIRLFVVGRKGRDFFKRLGYPLQGEYVNIANQISYIHAEIIGKDLIQAFLDQGLSEVTIIYNEFKSVIQQKLVQERLLPLSASDAPAEPSRTVDFLYEPRKEELLNALLPRYVKSQIYRVLLESFASELGARMAAMDSATKNAKELIEHLTLKLNRSRQAIITREIAELVGGAEALK